MAIRILVVDDSSFFCQMVGNILNSDSELEVIGYAHNGREAIQKAADLKPDIITMDVEMPVMDGVTATKQIMSATPTAVLMFSSLTYDGARSTLDALSAGAVDFLLKSYEEVSPNNPAAGRSLIEKVKKIGQEILRQKKAKEQPQSDVKTNLAQQKNRSSDNAFQILIIGASTGGPVAVQKILTKFPEDFPLPIVIVQHMPEAFTPAFAARLDDFCNIKVKEAEDNDVIQAGTAYIAPGGKQLVFEGSKRQSVIRVRNSDARLTYQPSVDVTLGSAAKTFADGVLACILTGMGSDGREGARLLQAQGSTIWAQNEASCVVYGMPMAVINSGVASNVLELNRFSAEILKEVM